MEPAPDRPDDSHLIRQPVLQNTLEEVASRQEDASTDCCVICLDVVVEPCEALPCGHRNFDYACVSNWLFETPQCPLCKARVVKVVHGPTDAPVTTFFEEKKTAAAAASSSSSSTAARAYSSFARSFYTAGFERRARPHCPESRRRPGGFREQSRAPAVGPATIATRRDVYRHRRFSKHVGSNRLSRYRELTPDMFCTDAELVSRARMWMRRELAVFSFLSPDEDVDDDDGSASRPDSPSAVSRTEAHHRRRRRALNAEFLLEYIVAILKSVDVMGSAGQAEDMLSEFLGRDSTKLFLHELRAWLRSPFTKLEDWDRAVQYEPVSEARRPARDEAPRGDLMARRGTRVHHHRGQGVKQEGDFYRPRRGGGERRIVQSAQRAQVWM
ncbi:hypothetical protein E4U41_005759 [Claviceps citrina]|nr:hypothetical protein E4U41_005759 [Claviceps citrina]